jgi:hypothetical protein
LVRVADEFTNRKHEIENLWQKLARLTKSLEANPFYLYSLKRFINEIKSFEEGSWPISAICKHLYDLLSNFWFSISSATSAVLPLDKQRDLALFLSSCLKRLNVPPDTPERFLRFNREVLEIEKDIRNRLKAIKKIPLTPLKSQPREIITKLKYPEWKKGLINLIGIWGLFEKRDLPEYILKSGLRSFYFFDFSRPIYDPRIREEFIQYVNEGINECLEDLKRRGVDVKNALLITKTYGEEPGTILLAAVNRKQYHTDIQVLPTAPWFDVVRGLSLEKGEQYRPIIIDSITTTGGTLKEILNRLEEMGYKVGAYIVIIDRSSKGLQFLEKEIRLPIISLISFKDLLEAGILEPEILLGDLDSPIYLTLDLKRDTIYEICVFHHKDDEYKELIKRYHDLICKAFNGDGKIKLLKENEDFRNVITNILILSYNSIKKHYSFISKLDGVEYLKYIAEVESNNPLILGQIVRLLSDRFENNVHTSIDIEEVIDIFVAHYHELSNYIFKLTKKYIMEKPKEKYTDEELRKLAEIGAKMLEEDKKKRLGPSYEPSPEERRERFLRLYRIYKRFNEIFGKPPDEKFLGEKFFEGLPIPPEYRENKRNKHY